MFFLNDIARTEFYTDENIYIEFCSKTKNFEISNELLCSLEGEYSELLKKSVDHEANENTVTLRKNKKVKVRHSNTGELVEI